MSAIVQPLGSRVPVRVALEESRTASGFDILDADHPITESADILVIVCAAAAETVAA